MNFIEMVIAGQANVEDVNDFIDYWNNYEDSNISLSQYLGLTIEEYANFVKDSSSLVDIVEKRKSQSFNLDFKSLNGNPYDLLTKIGVLKPDGPVEKDYMPILSSFNFSRTELMISALIFLGFNYEDSYVIPGYQRSLVWNVEQKRALIESIFLGNPIGDVVINEKTKDKNGNLNVRVIDGQQRINAIRCFFNGEFKVFDKLVNEFKYWDLRTILDYRVYSYVGKNISIEDELSIYIARNNGGTIHSKSEIQKAIDFSEKIKSL